MRWVLGIGSGVIAIALGLLIWQARAGSSPAEPAGEPTSGDRKPSAGAPPARASTDPARSAPPAASARSGRIAERPRVADEPAAPPAADLAPPPPSAAEPPRLQMDASPEDQRRSRARKVQRLFTGGKYDAALAEAQALLADYPDDPDGLAVAAASLCAIGEPEEAKKHLDRLGPRTKARVKLSCANVGATLGP